MAQGWPRPAKLRQRAQCRAVAPQGSTLLRRPPKQQLSNTVAQTLHGRRGPEHAAGRIFNGPVHALALADLRNLTTKGVQWVGLADADTLRKTQG